jgi:rfaE bifunctional protein nucleotidyltransferase chain/domain
MLCHKIKTLPELKKVLRKTRASKKRIVFTNGCFDILHAGHVGYLEKAKSLGDMLIVGLNSDVSVRKLKGKTRPIVTQKNRAKVLSSLSCVDYVVIFNALTPINLIKSIKPDVLVKGGDWKIKDIVGGNFVKSYGGSVRSLSYLKGFSTKMLIRKVKSL